MSTGRFSMSWLSEISRYCREEKEQMLFGTLRKWLCEMLSLIMDGASTEGGKFLRLLCDRSRVVSDGDHSRAAGSS